MPINKEKLKNFLSLTDTETLGKMKQILTFVDEDVVSKKDFDNNFKDVYGFLKKLTTKNQGQFSNLTKSQEDKLEGIRGENNTSISQIKEELTKLINQAIKSQEDGLNFVRDKAISFKDFTDGINGLDGADGADGNDGSPDTPYEIRNKLESLKGKSRLNVSAIKGLKEELDKKAGVHSLSGGSGGIGGSVRYFDLSSKLNGVLKTFSLPAFARILSVQSSSFPNAFRETTDYTVDGSAFTITFTSEINASTTLDTNQTITILYAQQ